MSGGFDSPLRELRKSGLHQGVRGGFNLWRQDRSPIRGRRLHSKQNHFLRRSVYEAQSAHQV